MAAQFCGDPDIFTIMLNTLVYPVSFAPKTQLFLFGDPDLLHALYLVPLARSRYCASPEASILTKAKAKLEHPPTEGRQLRTKH